MPPQAECGKGSRYIHGVSNLTFSHLLQSSYFFCHGGRSLGNRGEGVAHLQPAVLVVAPLLLFLECLFFVLCPLGYRVPFSRSRFMVHLFFVLFRVTVARLDKDAADAMSPSRGKGGGGGLSYLACPSFEVSLLCLRKLMSIPSRISACSMYYIGTQFRRDFSISRFIISPQAGSSAIINCWVIRSAVKVIIIDQSKAKQKITQTRFRRREISFEYRLSCRRGGFYCSSYIFSGSELFPLCFQAFVQILVLVLID